MIASSAHRPALGGLIRAVATPEGNGDDAKADAQPRRRPRRASTGQATVRVAAIAEDSELFQHLRESPYFFGLPFFRRLIQLQTEIERRHSALQTSLEELLAVRDASKGRAARRPKSARRRAT